MHGEYTCRRARRSLMATTQQDILQGTLDLLILKTVALGPIHGYSIGQRIQQVSKEVLLVRQGSLYPALHRLEERGLLDAEWGTTETGREAKFYKLSRKGHAHLERETASWDQMARAIYAVLEA
jgi:PadR family transcriptional regulator PadR